MGRGRAERVAGLQGCVGWDGRMQDKRQYITSAVARRVCVLWALLRALVPVPVCASGPMIALLLVCLRGLSSSLCVVSCLALPVCALFGRVCICHSCLAAGGCEGSPSAGQHLIAGAGRAAAATCSPVPVAAAESVHGSSSFSPARAMPHQVQLRARLVVYRI